MEPARHRSPPDPLALRGRLGSGFARSIAVPAIEPWPEMQSTLTSRNFRRSVLDPFIGFTKRLLRAGARRRLASRCQRATPAGAALAAARAGPPQKRPSFGVRSPGQLDLCFIAF